MGAVDSLPLLSLVLFPICPTDSPLRISEVQSVDGNREFDEITISDGNSDEF